MLLAPSRPGRCKPTRTWQSAHGSVPALQNLKYLSSVTLFGAVGKSIRGGKLYMIAAATDIVHVKKFLVQLAGALKNPYSAQRPYLCLDNHPAHRSRQVREELSRFHVCFQPAYSSPANCQETIWSQLKSHYYTRLHRRDRDLTSDEEFRAMIRQLCDDIPINTDAILRANQPYLAKHLAMASEQESSDSF